MTDGTAETFLIDHIGSDGRLLKMWNPRTRHWTYEIGLQQRQPDILQTVFGPRLNSNGGVEIPGAIKLLGTGSNWDNAFKSAGLL